VHNDIDPDTASEIFEAAPCGYLFTDPDGAITRVNQTFLRWTGYASSDLVGSKRFQEMLTPPAAIFYETHLSPLLRMQGFIKEVTLDVVCANGAILPVLINSTIHADSSGAPAAILTTVFDIRERRKYERELLRERRKAESLASVVEQASDAIITMTRDLRVATWNRGATSLFGYTAAEALGRDLRDLILPPEEFADADKQLAKLTSGESVHYETTRRDKAGNPVAVSITVTPQIEPPDDVVGFSAIIRDIGDRKRLEEVQRQKRDLDLANRLAHEINNPLQAIVNCLTMLSLERSSQYVPIAEGHVERVAKVVRDLVKLTRNSDR
jgi:PAS domain S-box-containing protein